MKLNIFPALLRFILSILLGWMGYYFASNDENNHILGIGAIICLISTFIPTFAVDCESERISMNIKALSLPFILFFMGINIYYVFIHIAMPYYVIINGIGLIIYLLLFYFLQSKKDL